MEANTADEADISASVKTAIHAGATVVNCLADDDSRALAARPT